MTRKKRLSPSEVSAESISLSDELTEAASAESVWLSPEVVAAVREEWWDDAYKRYGASVVAAGLDEIRRSINEGEEEYPRLQYYDRAIEELKRLEELPFDRKRFAGLREEFIRLVGEWLMPYRNRQSESGRTSPGRRGIYKERPEKLLAEVQAERAKHPNRSFNYICRKVAEKYGLSDKPVKRAARAIQWPDPRRKSQ